jgi:hypothetical protein
LRIDAIDAVQLFDAVFDLSCTGWAVHLRDGELCNVSLVYRWGNFIPILSCVPGVFVIIMFVGMIRWFTTFVVGLLVWRGHT